MSFHHSLSISHSVPCTTFRASDGCLTYKHHLHFQLASQIPSTHKEQEHILQTERDMRIKIRIDATAEPRLIPTHGLAVTMEAPGSHPHTGNLQPSDDIPACLGDEVAMRRSGRFLGALLNQAQTSKLRTQIARSHSDLPSSIHNTSTNQSISTTYLKLLITTTNHAHNGNKLEPRPRHRLLRPPRLQRRLRHTHHAHRPRRPQHSRNPIPIPIHLRRHHPTHFHPCSSKRRLQLPSTAPSRAPKPNTLLPRGHPTAPAPTPPRPTPPEQALPLHATRSHSPRPRPLRRRRGPPHPDLRAHNRA